MDKNLKILSALDELTELLDAQKRHEFRHTDEHGLLGKGAGGIAAAGVGTGAGLYGAYRGNKAIQARGGYGAAAGQLGSGVREAAARTAGGYKAGISATPGAQAALAPGRMGPSAGKGLAHKAGVTAAQARLWLAKKIAMRGKGG